MDSQHHKKKTTTAAERVLPSFGVLREGTVCGCLGVRADGTPHAHIASLSDLARKSYGMCARVRGHTAKFSSISPEAILSCLGMAAWLKTVPTIFCNENDFLPRRLPHCLCVFQCRDAQCWVLTERG